MCKGRRWGGDGQRVHGASRDGRLHAYHLDTSILNSLASATYAADAIRRRGAIPSLELSHSGMYAGTYMTDKTRQHGLHQWGPSDTLRPDGVEVRALTEEMLAEMHQYARWGYTPKVKPGKSCSACSLKELCLPGLLGKLSPKKYLHTHLEEVAEE